IGSCSFLLAFAGGDSVCYTTIQEFTGLPKKEERMTLPHPLPDDLAELIARRFRLLAEPTRIKLLDRLRDGEATVSQLSEELDASQQNVSKQLAMLTEAGILARRKEANFAYYRIADEGVFALCDQICGSVQRQLHALNELVEGAGR